MNEQNLKNFIELISFDKNLVDLENKISAANQTLHSFQTKLSQLDQEFERYSAKKKEAQKQIHEQELKLKSLQDQEQHLSESIMQLKHAKEFEAAQKEIEHVKFERNQQEQTLVNLLNRFGVIQKEFETRQQTVEQEKVKLSDLMTHETQALQTFVEQLESLRKGRQEKIEKVPAEWLHLYENMKGKVQDPVVPVNQDSCSACFSLVAARDLQALQQKQMLQCKDCYRFLYQP